MDQTVGGEDQQSLVNDPISACTAYDGSAGSIGDARAFARDFLAQLQALHGLPVSGRAMDTVQLVVSELVTNTCKYAPGPCLLDLQLNGDYIEVTVWDSEPVLPVARSVDPGRVGQHGLEIIVAVCEGFEVRREPVGKRTRATIALADAAGRLL
ncbi:ATP-binding protein [Streptomyces sp. NPDC054786]